VFPLAIALVGCNASSDGQATAHQLVIQQASHVRLTYVAIGASDTFGTGTDDPSSQNWPLDLTEQLGNGVRLINLGIPGMHVHDALNAELPVALDSHPDLITVWLAVNDIADNVPLDSYSHDLDLLLGRIQSALPHARVMVANIPDITLLPRFKNYNADLLRTQINAYNTAIANIVQRHHGWLVDLYQRWKELANHPEYISSDGFHPNALGYTRIAEIFDQVLLQNGGA
jgi:lysophospholipase L1-like esterase